jgi:acetyl/propionyl-CoA carboxylase alpha subunit
VAAARAVDYEGVGTVEFVVGGAGTDGAAAYFLEMNTRLQVEHGVTELVTGVDLVALQLTVADGLPLPFTQDEVLVGGHAIEVRLCAERPREDHRPTPGRVLHARWPAGEGIRVDAGVETGSTVTATYDSLLAKVMAVGDRRAVAAARLRAALGGPLELDGVETNRQMLAAVLGDVDFGAGRTATDYLDAHPEVVAAGLDARIRRLHAAAASLFLERARVSASVVPGVPPSWRNVGHAQHQDHLTDGDDRLSVAVARPAGRLQVVVEGPGDLAAPLGAAIRAAVSATPRRVVGTVDLEVDGSLSRHRVRLHGPVVAVSSSGGQSTFTLGSEFGTEETGAAAGECRAPLPGSVVRVLVAQGDVVEDGAGLVVLEAMKMEHTLHATARCTVGRVLVTAGDQVDAGDLLVVAEAAE